MGKKQKYAVVAMDLTPDGCICYKSFSSDVGAWAWARMQRDEYDRDCVIHTVVETLEAKRKGDVTR